MGLETDEIKVDVEVGWRSWEGQVECSICGHGRDIHVRSVVEIPRDRDGPLVNLECSACGNMTLRPVG